MWFWSWCDFPCISLQYYEDAIYAFDAALAIDPFFLDAYLGRGNVMMDHVTLNHNAISRYVYFLYLRSVDAMIIWKIVVGVDLRFIILFIIYWRRDYSKVLRLNPFHLPARLNLAYCLQVMALITLYSYYLLLSCIAVSECDFNDRYLNYRWMAILNWPGINLRLLLV